MRDVRSKEADSVMSSDPPTPSDAAQWRADDAGDAKPDLDAAVAHLSKASVLLCVLFTVGRGVEGKAANVSSVINDSVAPDSAQLPRDDDSWRRSASCSVVPALPQSISVRCARFNVELARQHSATRDAECS